MISPTEENAPLLDPRLQFPVHTLPNERVVWSGSADARAYRAALLRAVWAIAAFALLALFVVHNGIDVDAPCARSDEIASKAAIDRDCSASVRTERAERLRAFQRGATRLALGAIAAALLLQCKRPANPPFRSGQAVLTPWPASRCAVAVRRCGC